MDIKERTHKEVLQDALADSNVKQEYEALDGEFQLRRKRIQDIKERREQLRNYFMCIDCSQYSSCDSPPLFRGTSVKDRCSKQRLRANMIIAKLSSLGLVFKVEGELPRDICQDVIDSYGGHVREDAGSYKRSQQDMLAAGYTKTEPLEEK